MHIPDGFLNTETVIITNAISIGFLIYAVKKVDRHLHPARIPLMGVTAAFIFTSQLLSFPLIGGTSLHLLGGVLISVLLGPFSGLIIMSTSLILQAILLQHGGILTLGANILNMGIGGCLLGYLIYKLFKSTLLGAAIAAWITIVLAAGLCAVELGISGRVPLKTALFSMSGAHILAGAAEGLITFAVLTAISKIRPDLLALEKT